MRGLVTAPDGTIYTSADFGFLSPPPDVVVPQALALRGSWTIAWEVVSTVLPIGLGEASVTVIPSTGPSVVYLNQKPVTVAGDQAAVDYVNDCPPPPAAAESSGWSWFGG